MTKFAPQSTKRRARRKPSPRVETGRDNTAERSRKEIGGPSGPEPTRYGDWERNGRCSDF